MTEFHQLIPFDEHNQRLASHVHPADWTNPTPQQPYHLVVVGAGTAGLVTAAGSAGLGARVALIERELMGGDCLNVGCVPSKGMIRAARVAATVRDAAAFGVHVHDTSIDFRTAMERMRRLRANISPADSAQRFADLGVDVFLGQGTFASPSSIAVTRRDGLSTVLNFKKAVIATGARASAPPIPGLDSVRYLTNETVFSLTELPGRLGVVGSGPVGSELAQSFARFGSQVYLFERSDHILPREDADAASVVQEEFKRDGVNLLLNSRNMEVSGTEDGRIRICISQQGQQSEFDVDELLVAVGRAANVNGLNLEAAGVKYDREGVKVDDHLQTSNPRIYAAGDICSKLKFTHAADFMARIAIQNALFAVGPLGKKKVSDLVIPWSTYTSPEIAHVGLYEHEAAQSGIEVDTYRQDLAHVDRAILEGQDRGFVKVLTRRGTDQIVGATIVAENAGDLISEITLAMKYGIGLAKIGSTIHPYPTQAEAIRKLGDQYNRTKLTSTSKGLLNFLRRLNVGG